MPSPDGGRQIASTEYLLSAIRGFLGLLAAIGLFIVAYLIQTGLQAFFESAITIPTPLVAILNALQITVGLAIAAAVLLIAGLIIRLRASDEEEEEDRE
ncbi:MAG: hypothetical protein ACE5EW_04680 [Thermoplasmata archaeon]